MTVKCICPSWGPDLKKKKICTYFCTTDVYDSSTIFFFIHFRITQRFSCMSSKLVLLCFCHIFYKAYKSTVKFSTTTVEPRPIKLEKIN